DAAQSARHQGRGRSRHAADGCLRHFGHRGRAVAVWRSPRAHAGRAGGDRRRDSRSSQQDAALMAIRFDDIGNRLKAFRLGSGLSADEIAARLGISRTALYRFEKGELAKIETLEKLSELLDVSIPTLLGVGVEYVASAISYFERMRQIEEKSEHIIVLAGPISYLLSSDEFDRTLEEVLNESVPEQLTRPK